MIFWVLFSLSIVHSCSSCISVTESNKLVHTILFFIYPSISYGVSRLSANVFPSFLADLTYCEGEIPSSLCLQLQVFLRLQASLAFFYLFHFCFAFLSTKMSNLCWGIKILLLGLSAFTSLFFSQLWLKIYVVWALIVSPLFLVGVVVALINLFNTLDRNFNVQGRFQHSLYVFLIVLFTLVGIALFATGYIVNIDNGQSSCASQKTIFSILLVSCVLAILFAVLKDLFDDGVGPLSTSLVFSFNGSYSFTALALFSGLGNDCSRLSLDNSDPMVKGIPMIIWTTLTVLIACFVYEYGEEGSDGEHRKADVTFFLVLSLGSAFLSIMPSSMGGLVAGRGFGLAGSWGFFVVGVLSCVIYPLHLEFYNSSLKKVE